MSTSRHGDVTYDLDSLAKWQLSEQGLLELIPEEFTLKVPCELIKYIVGDHGQNVRTRAANCGVAMEIPDALTKNDSVVLRGPPSKCAEIKRALLLLAEQLPAKQEEEKRRSLYRETISVEFRHFPALLGREGKGIVTYRDKHGVHIEVPARTESTQEREIAIFGYEHRVKAAKEDMLTFLKQLDTESHIEVKIDRGVYPRIVGAKGRRVEEIRKHYDVRIYFPKAGEPGEVKIAGPKENAEKAKRYLLYLEKFYMEKDAAVSKWHAHNRINTKDFAVDEERQTASHSPTTANHADGAVGCSILSRKRPS